MYPNELEPTYNFTCLQGNGKVIITARDDFVIKSISLDATAMDVFEYGFDGMGNPPKPKD